MKRIVILILVIASASLASCTHHQEKLSPISECDFTASSAEAEYSGHAHITPGSVTLDISSPPNAAGISYTFDSSELRTSLGDLSCITDPDVLAPSSLPRFLTEALLKLDEAAYISSVDHTDSYALTASFGEVIITAKDGVPESISSDICPYTVTLSYPI